MTLTELHVQIKAEYDRVQSLFERGHIKSTADWHHYQNVVAEYRAFIALFPALTAAA